MAEKSMFDSFMKIVDQAVREGLMPSSDRKKIVDAAKRAKDAEAEGDSFAARKRWKNVQKLADKALEKALMSAPLPESTMIGGYALRGAMWEAADPGMRYMFESPPAPKDIKATIKRYYEKVREEYPGKSKEYAARVAWHRFCKFKNPDHPSCTEFGKTGKLSAPKAESVDDGQPDETDLDLMFEGMLDERKDRGKVGAYGRSTHAASEVSYAMNPKGARSQKGRKDDKRRFNRAVRRTKKKDIDKRMRGEGLSGVLGSALEEGVVDEAKRGRPITVKPTKHHGEDAFLVSGRTESGYRIRIVVRKRKTAEKVRDAVKRGASQDEIGKLIMNESSEVLESWNRGGVQGHVDFADFYRRIGTLSTGDVITVGGSPFSVKNAHARPDKIIVTLSKGKGGTRAQYKLAVVDDDPTQNAKLMNLQTGREDDYAVNDIQFKKLLPAPPEATKEDLDVWFEAAL